MVKLKLWKIGAGIGFICSIIILLAGWDNLGILSLPSGIFTSLYILAIMFSGGEILLQAQFRVFNVIAYTITGALSWGILGYLWPRKLPSVIYIILWLFAGFYTTIIMAAAYG